MNGNIYIPRQKAILLKDLAKAMMALWGNRDTKMRVVGLRSEEKEHEQLFLPNEKVFTELENGSSQSVDKMTIEEITSLLQARMK